MHPGAACLVGEPGPGREDRLLQADNAPNRLGGEAHAGGGKYGLLSTHSARITSDNVPWCPARHKMALITSHFVQEELRENQHALSAARAKSERPTISHESRNPVRLHSDSRSRLSGRWRVVFARLRAEPVDHRNRGAARRNHCRSTAPLPLSPPLTAAASYSRRRRRRRRRRRDVPPSLRPAAASRHRQSRSLALALRPRSRRAVLWERCLD